VNSRKQLRKGLVTYYKTSGITCLWKHLDVDHSTIYKRFQEETNNQGKENVRRQSAKKRSLISNSFISNFFASKVPFKKDDVEQNMFVKNLAYLIVKNHFSLQFVESVWLKCLVL
jgi:hypothetical protein